MLLLRILQPLVDNIVNVANMAKDENAPQEVIRNGIIMSAAHLSNLGEEPDCHGHEGTNYVTRPWASDEGDIRTIKGQYRHSPQGEYQQSEEQPQTSISHHSPRGDCQYLNIKCH